MDYDFKNIFSIYKIENFAPEEPGIYILRDWRNKPIYIGKTNNIKKRLFNHSDPFSIHCHLEFVFHNVKYFSCMIVEDEQERSEMEKELIEWIKPPLNVEFNEDHTERYNEKYYMQTQIEYYKENPGDYRANEFEKATRIDIKPEEFYRDLEKAQRNFSFKKIIEQKTTRTS